MKNFNENLIEEESSIRQALEKLNDLSGSLNLTLFVLDRDRKLVGTLTDGDIRRGLLKGKNIDDKVEGVMFRNFRFLRQNKYTLKQVEEFKQKKIDLVPLLDEEGRIVKIYSFKEKASLLPVEGVIMAGGIGQRLLPLTQSVPKPMLKVGEKPIIEHNIDLLSKYGIDSIHISIRYLGEKIKEYFGNGQAKSLRIEYLEEKEPLGTIGSVKLAGKYECSSLLVMNSDLLTNIDLEDFYRKFEQDDAMLTVASIPYTIQIPYAVLEVEDTEIVSIAEKPTYSYFSNAGIYLMKKEALAYIPDHKPFDATDLIQTLIAEGEKVSVYSILGYWLDIGKHEDYRKAQEDIKHLKL